MASVIRVLTEHGVGGEAVQANPTWSPGSARATGGLYATALRALLRMPAGEVAHVHLSERGSFVREGWLLALADRRGLITVATIHGADFLAFAKRHPRLVSRVLRRARLVTCLQDEALDLVRGCAPGIRCELVPNPVVVEQTYTPADATDELVLFAGEIGLRKGADVLHRAWPLIAARRPGARCLMVGPIGDFEPPRLERLEVRAAVEPGEMRRLLGRARVIALPARAEAMPMILTEAMSAGRPFVGTAVGAIPELARAGGVLVAVGDERTLADELTDLLADPGLARSIGERGREFCMRTRGIEVIDGRLRELYAAAAAARD